MYTVTTKSGKHFGIFASIEAAREAIHNTSMVIHYSQEAIEVDTFEASWDIGAADLLAAVDPVSLDDLDFLDLDFNLDLVYGDLIDFE